MKTMDNEESSAHNAEYNCLLNYGQPCTSKDNLDNIKQEEWESIKKKALKWRELDKVGDAYDMVDGQRGPTAHFMHASCYTSIFSNDRLHKAQKRKKKNQRKTLHYQKTSYFSITLRQETAFFSRIVT